MKLRFRSSNLLTVSICSGVLLLSAPWSSPPTASTAPCGGGTVLDPRTGICWSQNQPNNSYGGSGNIPCLPGRLGLCLGALQNTPEPGAALRPAPPAGPAPRPGTWP